MFRHAPPPALLPMSHIIAMDAPLLSPTAADPADAHPHHAQAHPYLGALAHHAPSSHAAGSPYAYDAFTYSGASSSGSAAGRGCDSPLPAALKMQMRGSPEHARAGEAERAPLCVPTHQVFDLGSGSGGSNSGWGSSACSDADAGSPYAFADDDAPLVLATAASFAFDGARKRSASPCPAGGAPKRPRAAGERMSTKDFVPPDVTGLSKREARLVKNRAAAFLSRQRKREEFELMEIRVADLERENAVLRASSSLSSLDADPTTAAIHAAAEEQLRTELRAEVERLRAALAGAERRTADMAAQLALARPSAIKTEPLELGVPPRSMAASPVRGRSVSLSAAPLLGASSKGDRERERPERSGASLGLMVLLCALPTLLAMPASHAQGGVPARFGLPLAGAGASGIYPASNANGHSASSRGHGHGHGHSASLSSLDALHALIPGAREHEYDPYAAFELEPGMGMGMDPLGEFGMGMDMGMDMPMGGMDIDMDMNALLAAPAPPATATVATASASSVGPSMDLTGKAGTLEFADEALGQAVAGLDIAFDAAPGEDGRIRVRIHAPSDSASASTSSSSTSASSAFTSLAASAAAEDPFLGVGMPGAYGYDAFDGDDGMGMFDFAPLGRAKGVRAESGAGAGAGAETARRRVRIALKGAPRAGGEGGEWEVEVC